MNILVIYRSKYGFTRTYAEWIAQALNQTDGGRIADECAPDSRSPENRCDLKEGAGLDVGSLSCYDTIICGGGLYAGGINGLKLITDRYDTLKDKNLVVWATGACSGYPHEQEHIWEQNLSSEQRQTIKTFYLRGGFNYSLLNRTDKFLMKGMKLMLKTKKDKTQDDKMLLQAYDIPVDFRDRTLIQPLIEHVKQLG